MTGSNLLCFIPWGVSALLTAVDRVSCSLPTFQIIGLPYPFEFE